MYKRQVRRYPRRTQDISNLFAKVQAWVKLVGQVSSTPGLSIQVLKTGNMDTLHNFARFGRMLVVQAVTEVL